MQGLLIIFAVVIAVAVIVSIVLTTSLRKVDAKAAVTYDPAVNVEVWKLEIIADRLLDNAPSFDEVLKMIKRGDKSLVLKIFAKIKIFESTLGELEAKSSRNMTLPGGCSVTNPAVVLTVDYNFQTVVTKFMTKSEFNEAFGKIAETTEEEYRNMVADASEITRKEIEALEGIRDALQAMSSRK